MRHLNSARELAHKRGLICRILSVLLFFNLIVSTPSGAAATPEESHFIDPIAIVQCGPPNRSCTFGSGVYIGPFATLTAGLARGNKTPSITIGDESNVQDNVLLDASHNPITLGHSVIIAHGASVYGGAEIGVGGTCRPGIVVCASFVGFNSEIAEGAVVQRDAMVTHLAKVDSGVTIPSERVVVPGVEIKSDLEIPEKTEEITELDRQFMANVIRVNLALAAGYTKLENERADNVCGINKNPETPFAPESLPSLAGVAIREPKFHNRIIGKVEFSQTKLPNMGDNVSLRADEGTPFVVGRIGYLKDFVTFHALEHTSLRLGADGQYGAGSLVHGGTFRDGITITGNNFKLGTDAVFYSAIAGNNCQIGAMSFVATSNLAAGTVIAPKAVFMNGREIRRVEWDRRTRPKVKNNHGRPS